MASVHEQWSLAVTSIYYHGRKKQPGLTEVLDQAGLPFTPWPLETCVGVLSEAREPLVLGALRMAIADIVRNRGHLGDAKFVDEQLAKLVQKYGDVARVDAAAVKEQLLGIKDADPNTAYLKALAVMHKAEDPHESAVVPFANYKATRHG